MTLAADTLRRITQASGRAAVVHEQAEGDELERLAFSSAPMVLRDCLQQVSVDGALAPVLGGTWEEVKSMAVGRVEQTGEGPHAVALSYFSRLTDSASFTASARRELLRRHTADARAVVAVTDGALWIEGFVDENLPTATHIIDWPHASGYVRAASQALFGAGTADSVAWTKTYLDLLWEGNAEVVVAELRRLESTTSLEEVRSARHYLERRLDQLRYADFRAAGYPTGSGIVESANKLVVEARLKGPGKHWQRANVNPMLALRCLSANQRWDDSWQEISRRLRRSYRGHRPPAPSGDQPRIPRQPPPPTLSPPLPTFVDGKPTAAHPWKAGLRRRAKT